MNSTHEILHEFLPLLRVYKDGRLERLVGNDVVYASVDPKTGVQSKDVTISPETGIAARLYLPKTVTTDHKLPLLIYFHGGGFLVESAFSPTYHNHLNLLVAEANVVVVSVEYRLAPEHPLPTAYEDSWVALEWVASQSRGDGDEVWMKDYVDFQRVFFGGDSAGGNIAHNMAIRVGSNGLDGINLVGIYLNCPFFWGEDPIGVETDDVNIRGFANNIWRFVNPNTSGSDDPLLNPDSDPNVAGLGCAKVLVYVAEKDLLKERGWYYKEVLRKKGWVGDADVVEAKGEDHVYFLFNPTCDNAVDMYKKVASFLNQTNA